MAKTAQSSGTNLHINLLHPQGEPQETPQKFFHWLLSYGRFIVIVVDIIVISCFLLRFKLDADLQNINHQIEAEQQHIQSQSTQEALVKQTHQQLQIVKQTYDNSPDWQTILASFSNLTPQNTLISKITAEHTQNSKELTFKITASTNNNLEIAGFLNNLRQSSLPETDRDFKELDVTSLALDQGQFQFVITGKTNR